MPFRLWRMLYRAFNIQPIAGNAAGETRWRTVPGIAGGYALWIISLTLAALSVRRASASR